MLFFLDFLGVTYGFGVEENKICSWIRILFRSWCFGVLFKFHEIIIRFIFLECLGELLLGAVAVEAWSFCPTFRFLSLSIGVLVHLGISCVRISCCDFSSIVFAKCCNGGDNWRWCFFHTDFRIILIHVVKYGIIYKLKYDMTML